MNTILCYSDGEDGNKFFDSSAEIPPTLDTDVLVNIKAISINPADCKIKNSVPISKAEPKILGWDAVGEIIKIGKKVKGYSVGERVWYAGDFTRQGSYAEAQNVDYRIISKCPANLQDNEAAALPLTSLTAWECLFEKLGFSIEDEKKNSNYSFLIINGAGGVGSITTQLAKQFGIKVATTASRSTSKEWCRQMGAVEVIEHKALHSLPANTFDRILCCHDTDSYFDEMARLIKPQGIICALSSAKQKHDIQALMQKSATFTWEFMFTKTMFKTPNITSQHSILEQIRQLIEKGDLQTTMTSTIHGMNAANIQKAHDIQNRGGLIGKQVINA